MKTDIKGCSIVAPGDECEIRKAEERRNKAARLFRDCMIDSLTDKIREIAKIDTSKPFALTDTIRKIEALRDELNASLPVARREAGLEK